MRDRDDDDRDDDDRDDDRPRRYDDEDDRRRVVPYPSMLRNAGYLWVIFGLIILVNGGINVMMSVGGAGGADQDAKVAGGTCGILVVALLGGVFIHVGMQSINGTARDTMGNGIGSMIIGLLQAGGGVVYLRADMMLPAVVSFVGCAGLMAAGVMAILARADYQEWKKQNKGVGGSDGYFGKRGRDDD